MTASAFQETALSSTPIRDLGLTIAGTRLEPILAEFEKEIAAIGLSRVKPRFYLSTEWGVPMGTVAIAIPFYLAHPDLTALHARRTGHIEGAGRSDILRYLRHEMGHVVNYAYRLYESPDWITLFGSITQPYVDEYRPEPFSRRYVRHLPGWYAQKHPDEDWAETFAVVITKGLDWKREYEGWPDALAKLRYASETVEAVKNADPIDTDEELDEDVGEIDSTLEQYYESLGETPAELPHGLDGALRTIFQDLPRESGAAEKPAALLIRRLEPELLANVYRWTGHFPEQSRPLVHHMAEKAEELGETYPEDQEASAIVGLTTLLAALAMNKVCRGTYLP